MPRPVGESDTRSDEGGRVAFSVMLALISLALGAVYTTPALVQRVITPGQVSVVGFVESHGPVAVTLFGFAGFGLLACVVAFRRYADTFHALSAAVFVGYDMALWWGALTSRPHGTVVTPVLVVGYVIFHLGMAMAWSTANRGTTQPAPSDDNGGSNDA